MGPMVVEAHMHIQMCACLAVCVQQNQARKKKARAA